MAAPGVAHHTHLPVAAGLAASWCTRCPFLELPPLMTAIGSGTGARLPSRVWRDEPDPVEASQRG